MSFVAETINVSCQTRFIHHIIQSQLGGDVTHCFASFFHYCNDRKYGRENCLILLAFFSSLRYLAPKFSFEAGRLPERESLHLSLGPLLPQKTRIGILLHSFSVHFLSSWTNQAVYPETDLFHVRKNKPVGCAAFPTMSLSPIYRRCSYPFSFMRQASEPPLWRIALVRRLWV